MYRTVVLADTQLLYGVMSAPVICITTTLATIMSGHNTRNTYPL